jgi:hypothetical protein
MVKDMELDADGDSIVSGKQHGELYYFWQHLGVFLVVMILCVLYDILGLHPDDCDSMFCCCSVNLKDNFELAAGHIVTFSLLAQAFAFLLMAEEDWKN